MKILNIKNLQKLIPLRMIYKPDYYQCRHEIPEM